MKGTEMATDTIQLTKANRTMLPLCGDGQGMEHMS